MQHCKTCAIACDDLRLERKNVARKKVVLHVQAERLTLFVKCCCTHKKIAKTRSMRMRREKFKGKTNSTRNHVDLIGVEVEHNHCSRITFFLSCFQFSSLFFSIRSLSVHFASILVSCCCWLFGCCIHHSRPRSKGREKNDRAMWIQEFFSLFCPF